MNFQKSLFLLAFILPIFFITMQCSQEQEIPRWEHPRPDFKRAQWINLNGQWAFEFDPKNQGETAGWFQPGKHTFTQSITVPFPWEAPLSGIANHEYTGVGWYQREFDIPSNWERKHILLKFGALDYEGKVWINGKYVGQHQGGYTPFEFDVTPFVHKGKNVLTVRAEDRTESWQPTGKQIRWYTHTSGIWQTVYLEACASDVRMTRIHISPDIDRSQATFNVQTLNAGTERSAQLEVAFLTGGVPGYRQKISLKPGVNSFTFSIPIKEVKLWSPEHPFLYEVSVKLRDEQLLDQVDTYFGMRKISTGKWGNHDFEYIFLNNKPYYLIGALNQTFNPEGIYTYPSDDYARGDVEKAKKFGFNFLRLHIKIDEPRFLYWADRLGLLLMCDMPNFWQDSTLARQAYDRMLKEAIDRDFNHPSIFAWCLFNETWGLGFSRDYTPERQEWVRAKYRQAKAMDPTRLVEDMSPCFYDHVETDINSWHFYINDYERAKEHIKNVVENTFPGSSFNYIGDNRQGTQPLMNSEYGGISAGSGDQDISWCFKYLTNELRKYNKIGGYIYTELQDIEWEHNGFMDYDRKDKYFGYRDVLPGFSYRDLNKPDFIVIDSSPCPAMSPGDEFSVNIFGSHFSNDQHITGKLVWHYLATNMLGQTETVYDDTRPASLDPYDVVSLGNIRFTLPSYPHLGTLDVRFEDGAGNTIARNYINIDAGADHVPAVTRTKNGDIILRFNPEDYTERKWQDDLSPQRLNGGKVAGTGAGHVTYEVPLPEDINRDAIQAIDLLFEAAAKAPIDAKVDARFPGAYWSRKKPNRDYPQTDATKWPSDVTVIVNGVEVKTITLPDDPADARGVLSHERRIHPGSHGYLQRISVLGEQLEQIKKTGGDKLTVTFRVKDDAVHKGGFALFGHKLGGYPVPPTVILRTLN